MLEEEPLPASCLWAGRQMLEEEGRRKIEIAQGHKTNPIRGNEGPETPQKITRHLSMNSGPEEENIRIKPWRRFVPFDIAVIKKAQQLGSDSAKGINKFSSGKAWEWTEWGRCLILDLYFAGQLTAFGCTHWLIITLQWEKNTSQHALAMFALCHVVGYVPFVSTVFIIPVNSMSFLDVHWASAVFIHVHLCSSWIFINFQRLSIFIDRHWSSLMFIDF